MDGNFVNLDGILNIAKGNVLCLFKGAALNLLLLNLISLFYRVALFDDRVFC